jgi:hypothetical protein
MGGGVWACCRTPSKTEATGVFLCPLAFFTASQITNHPASLTAAYVFTTYQLSDESYPTWAYLDTSGVSSRYVRYWLPMPYPKITSSLASQTKRSQGASSQHAFMHSIEINATYQVRTFLVRSSWPISSDEVILILRVHRRPEVLCGKARSSEAPTRHAAMTRGLACKPAGQNRVCKSLLGFNPVTGAEFGIASDCHLGVPDFVFQIGEWRGGFSGLAHVHMSQSVPGLGVLLCSSSSSIQLLLTRCLARGKELREPRARSARGSAGPARGPSTWLGIREAYTFSNKSQ